jgi:serine protease Do
MQEWEMIGMRNRFWVSQKPRTAVTAAALAALMIGGTGLALAGSDSSQSSSAQSSSALSAAAVQSSAAVVPLSGFADIVDSVRPAVVNIEAVREAGWRPDANEDEIDPLDDFFERFSDERGEGPGADDDDEMRESMKRWFREFQQRRHEGDGYQGERHGRFRDRQQGLPMRAAGAGFIIDADGTIVTNNHVVAGADRINVTLNDGRSFEATLVGRDPATDLAVIEIEAEAPLPFVVFGDSEAARVGDWVLTIGNPFGLENSVSMGIISARGRSIGAGRYDDFLQIDAPINRGNSGGPAFNTRGEVIGVNTAIFSPSGGSVGIGFAIPSSMVQEIVAELQDEGRVERGWLGVRIQPVTEDLAEGLDLDEAKGALISEVTDDSPAEAAGLAVGDVVLSVNDKPIDDVRDLTRTIARLDPGEDAELELWRQGEMASVTVRLGAFPEPEQVALADPDQPKAGEAVMGMRLAELDERAREAFDIEEETEGVLITAVQPDSWAARKGLRRGDVIVQAGQAPVSSPAEVAAAVESARQEDRKAVLVLISREEEERFVTLPLRDA